MIKDKISKNEIKKIIVEKIIEYDKNYLFNKKKYKNIHL
jgi:hypothetical protein